MFANIDFSTLEVNSTVLKAILHFEGKQMQFKYTGEIGRKMGRLNRRGSIFGPSRCCL